MEKKQEYLVDVFGQIWRVVPIRFRFLFEAGERTLFTGEWEADT